MKVVGYKVKRLSWESRKLKKIKDLLDNAVKERQTQRARDRTLPRTDQEEKSLKLPPKDLPDWAISQD